ncbi:MAG: hypothetical protein AB1412_07150 [Pseudomonadota bacterium]
MRLDKVLNYDPTPIARLEHGVSQAVARLLITHSVDRQPNGGWKIDTVIEATAGALNDQDMRNARRRLRSDAVGLREIGIEIDDDRVRRVPQPPDLCHTRPVPLGISGLFRPEMADSLPEPAIQAHLLPAGHPPLPGLVTAACPAPAGALAFGRQHDGDQASIAGTGTVAGDEENRPRIVAGSIRGRPKAKGGLLTGLIHRSTTSASPTTRKAAQDDSAAFSGHSNTGATHG